MHDADRLHDADRMHDADRLLIEAAAAIQADADADVRAEAYEVFVAEASRCRLVDRAGPVRLRLTCGVTLQGTLDPASSVSGLLSVREPVGRHVLVDPEAVAHMVGSHAVLRDEDRPPEQTLGRWLREAWADGDPVRALDCGGEWHGGPVIFVGADHVGLAAQTGPIVLPWCSVQAWAR
jgi:hypothetical protein